MYNKKIALFQGQIETALKNFRAELDLRCFIFKAI